MKKPPIYRYNRIGTISALARTLRVDAKLLQSIASRADRLYRTASEIEKPDGSIRRTFDARPPLKEIQARIKREILDRVEFPFYLTGGIKGCDYKTNAVLHCKVKIAISEDISGFFPSTTAAHVYGIWSRFFRFSDEVSACLTALTTKEGELPQGASTSSHLANLVFWEYEPKLEARFASQHVTYSRYVDDIGISSKTPIRPDQKTWLVAQVYGMLYRYGYHPKRTKHELMTAKDRMVMTKLGINRKPSLSRQERSKIRAAVHEIKRDLQGGQGDQVAYRQVVGRVAMLGRFHPHEAAKLKKELADLARLYAT